MLEGAVKYLQRKDMNKFLQIQLMIKIKEMKSSDIYLSKSRVRFSKLSLDRLRFGGSRVSFRLN